MTPDDPRRDLYIRWHPGYAFGEPTICTSAIKAESVASLIWAGDSVEEVAEDYGLTVDQVRLACWWLQRRIGIWDGWDGWMRDPDRWSAWDRWADRWLFWAGGHADDNPGNPPAEGTP